MLIHASYMTNTSLPLEILESQEMMNIWDELNRNIVL